MKGCLYFFGKDFDDILQSMEEGWWKTRPSSAAMMILRKINLLTDMYGCAGLKYAVIDRVVALIMKLEPEEFWRLESEAYDI